MKSFWIKQSNMHIGGAKRPIAKRPIKDNSAWGSDEEEEESFILTKETLEFKKQAAENDNWEALYDDILTVNESTASPSVKAQTASPSVKAQTASPSVKAQTASPSVKAQTASPSVKAQTASPSVKTTAIKPDNTFNKRKKMFIHRPNDFDANCESNNYLITKVSSKNNLYKALKKLKHYEHHNDVQKALEDYIKTYEIKDTSQQFKIITFAKMNKLNIKIIHAPEEKSGALYYPPIVDTKNSVENDGEEPQWLYLYYRKNEYHIASCVSMEQALAIEAAQKASLAKVAADKAAAEADKKEAFELSKLCGSELQGDYCVKLMRSKFLMKQNQVDSALNFALDAIGASDKKLVACAPNTPILSLSDAKYAKFVPNKIRELWTSSDLGNLLPMQQLLIGAMIHQKDIIVHASIQTGKTTAICFEALRAANYFATVHETGGYTVAIACNSKNLVRDIILKFENFVTPGNWNIKIVGIGKAQEVDDEFDVIAESFKEINERKINEFRKAKGDGAYPNMQIMVGTLAAVNKKITEDNTIRELIIDEADHFLGNDRESYDDKPLKYSILTDMCIKTKNAQFAFISATFDNLAKKRAVETCIRIHKRPPQILLTRDLIPENLRTYAWEIGIEEGVDVRPGFVTKEASPDQIKRNELDYRLYKLLQLYEAVQVNGRKNVIAFLNNADRLKVAKNLVSRNADSNINDELLHLKKQYAVDGHDFLLRASNAEERQKFLSSDKNAGYLYLAQSDEAKGIDFPCRVSVVVELPENKRYTNAFNAVIHKLGRASNVKYNGVGIIMYFPFELEDENGPMASLLSKNSTTNLNPRPLQGNMVNLDDWLDKEIKPETCGNILPANQNFYEENQVPDPKGASKIEVLVDHDDESLLYEIKSIFSFRGFKDQWGQDLVLDALRRLAKDIQEGRLGNTMKSTGTSLKATIGDFIKLPGQSKEESQLKERPAQIQSRKRSERQSRKRPQRQSRERPAIKSIIPPAPKVSPWEQREEKAPSGKMFSGEIGTVKPAPAPSPSPSSYAEAVGSDVSQSVEQLGPPEEEVVFNEKVAQKTNHFFLGTTVDNNIYVKKTEAQKKSIPKLYKNDKVTFSRVLDDNRKAINGRVEIISVEHTADRRLTGVVQKVGKSASGGHYYLFIKFNNIKVYYKMNLNDRFKKGDRVRFDIRNATDEGLLPTAYNLTKE